MTDRRTGARTGARVPKSVTGTARETMIARRDSATTPQPWTPAALGAPGRMCQNRPVSRPTEEWRTARPSRQGAGASTRSTGRPPTSSSGRYTRCVRGSTLTVCACGARRAPSGRSVSPVAQNAASTPDSDATYSRRQSGSHASTSGSSPTRSRCTTRMVRRSTTAGAAFPLPVTNARRPASSSVKPCGRRRPARHSARPRARSRGRWQRARFGSGRSRGCTSRRSRNACSPPRRRARSSTASGASGRRSRRRSRRSRRGFDRLTAGVQIGGAPQPTA